MRIVRTIRGKVLQGLLLPSICLAVLTTLSYNNLMHIEQHITVLGRIDAVERSIMELRHQGKYFLFNGSKNTYEAVLDITSKTMPLLDAIQADLLFPQQLSLVDMLKLRLTRYRDSIMAVHAVAEDPDRRRLTLKSEAHELSMDLEELTMVLSGSVRERIAQVSAEVRGQLLAAALAVAGLFVLLGYFIYAHVLNPLKTIERTTRKIAEGKFTPVPLGQNRDEMRSLQEAFNSMVLELKKRQEQLVQSQKLSSIGTLSAGIAHQVNNPLNNISLSAQFLRGGCLEKATPMEAKALDNIEKETSRARDIVRGLLDFSRQSECVLRPVTLKSVTDNAVRFASAQLPPRVRIESDIPSDLLLNLDAQRMSEALLNIITNAVHAIGEKKGTVRLHLTPESRNGTVTLVIEDNGRGIAPEDLPHVFDPFFTRKEVGKGTGLGLSIGYGIIEECGGGVRVESVLGKGSRFYIELPLPESDIAEKQ